MTKTKKKKAAPPSQPEPAVNHGDREHHPLSPSNWPKWSLCPGFTSDGKAGAAAQRGTRVHEAIEHLLNATNPNAVPGINQEELDLAQWAVDQFKAVHADGEFRQEDKVGAVVGGIGYFGYTDVSAKDSAGGLHLWDWKTGGVRNYAEQMAGYALPIMDREFADDITVHIVYVDQREVVVYPMTRDEAAEIAHGILSRRVNHTDADLSANSYCTWCSRCATCPALARSVTVVAPHLETEAANTDAVATVDLSTPEARGHVYAAAEIVIKKCEALKAEIKRLAEAGQPADGYRLTPCLGREAIDPKDAWRVVGERIGTDRFLAAATINPNKLRKAWENFSQDPFPAEKLISRAEGYTRLDPNK